MESTLIGKTALVGGSTQGIGKATAKLLADKGASIILLARNIEKLEKTRLELNTEMGQIHSLLVADFNDPDKVAQVVKEHIDNCLLYTSDAADE